MTCISSSTGYRFLIKGVACPAKTLFIIGAGCNNPHALSQSTFPKSAIMREGDTKTKNKKTDMKNMIMKLLGLNTLVEELALLKKQNEEFTNRIKHLDDEVNALEERVQEKIDEIESIDTDDFVREDDINDRIESYINDNDIVSQSYVDDEIESRVSEKVEEAIEELDIEDKVTEVVDNMDKASFGDTEELKDIVKEVLKTIKFKVE
jgi:hypothetical protein